MNGTACFLKSHQIKTIRDLAKYSRLSALKYIRSVTGLSYASAIVTFDDVMRNYETKKELFL